MKLIGVLIAFFAANFSLALSSNVKKVAVFGGTGYVGTAVCERLVKKGFDVTAVSRRGTNPKPDDECLSQVKWVVGDATDPSICKKIVNDNDAVVHAIGLLFDVNSGLADLNKIVSGSGSLPGESSTYDAITRGTMYNIIDASIAKSRFNSLTGKSKFPICFVSAAEAGWPEVSLGPQVEEKLAPEWLRRYLEAKRSVEAKLSENSKTIRSVVFRPSLIWDFSKFDVLPAIPIFNLASALGVPFVDKTVRIETLADAIVAGLEDEELSGVQRFMQMEELAKR